MNDLLAVLNHLLAAWIVQRGAAVPEAPWLRLEEILLEEDGFRIAGRVEHPAAVGEIVIRGRIESIAPARSRVYLRLERCPGRLSPGLEPFRAVLESARLHIDLHFDEAGILS